MVSEATGMSGLFINNPKRVKLKLSRPTCERKQAVTNEIIDSLNCVVNFVPSRREDNQVMTMIMVILLLNFSVFPTPLA